MTWAAPSSTRDVDDEQQHYERQLGLLRRRYPQLVGATLTIANSTFSGNFCGTTFNAHGGGILNEGGTVKIGNTNFKAGLVGENIYNVQQLGPVTSLGYN